MSCGRAAFSGMFPEALCRPVIVVRFRAGPGMHIQVETAAFPAPLPYAAPRGRLCRVYGGKGKSKLLIGKIN